VTWAPGEQLEISPDHSAGPLGLDVTCMSLVNVKFERAVDVDARTYYTGPHAVSSACPLLL